MKVCLPPSAPLLECSSTKLFGVPKGRSGRLPPLGGVETPISGIAIHCLPDDYTGYLAKVCNAPASLMPCEHASMHYVVNADTGQISCLVPEANVAWAFQSYMSNQSLGNPVEPYPGWPTLRAQFPNLSADFYTINIGIASGATKPTVDGDVCCNGPYGMSDKAYTNFIQLLAWIADRYNIPINAQHIALHDDIVETIIGCEECFCREDNCLLCDISSYCQGCTAVGDPSFPKGDEIAFIYGETISGCKVKISLEDFLNGL